MTKFLRSLLKRYYFFIPLTILFFATSVYFLLRSDVFLLRELVITQHTRERFVSEDELKDHLSAYLARSLLTLDTTSIQNKVLDENLALRKIIIKKDFPDKLVIEVWERTPVAVINEFVVDKDGLVFHEASSRHQLNLPELEVTQEQKYQLGDRLVGGVVRNSLQVIKSIQQNEERGLESITLEERGILKIVTSDKAEILLDSGKDIDKQIASLQTILKDAKINGKQVAKIDLRFAKPVVVYE